MKGGTNLLTFGTGGVEGRFVREFMLLMDVNGVREQSTIVREGSPLIFCYKAFFIYFPTSNKKKIWQKRGFVT